MSTLKIINRSPGPKHIRELNIGDAFRLHNNEDNPCIYLIIRITDTGDVSAINLNTVINKNFPDHTGHFRSDTRVDTFTVEITVTEQ